MEVNIYEAKTHLSRLIEQALKGEEVTIARNGKPLVRLTRIAPRQPILGSAEGKFILPDDWDSPETNKIIEDLFHGE